MLKILVRRTRDLSYLVDDRALELEGVRDGDARWNPLVGRGVDDPTDALSSPRRGDVVGYDLIIAAPRPASIVLAVGDEREQRAAVLAHREAVTDAVSYLDGRAAVVRRRILGDEEYLPGGFSSVTGFTHGVNRAGEPHLHDHVIVSSSAARYGRSLDGRSLFAHAAAADAIYRAGLREGLERHAGRASWRSFRGIEYVDGVDEGLRALWPGRASDRAPKRHVTRDEVVQRWRNDLAERVEGPLIDAPRRERSRLDEHAFAASFEGHEAITRRDVVRAWADAAVFGAPAGSIEDSVSRSYPELESSIGMGGAVLSRDAARRTALVRSLGARELSLDHRVVRERSRGALDRSLER